MHTAFRGKIPFRKEEANFFICIANEYAEREKCKNEKFLFTNNSKWEFFFDFISFK